jgi:hypothetical protein
VEVTDIVNMTALCVVQAQHQAGAARRRDQAPGVAVELVAEVPQLA